MHAFPSTARRSALALLLGACLFAHAAEVAAPTTAWLDDVATGRLDDALAALHQTRAAGMINGAQFKRVQQVIDHRKALAAELLRRAEEDLKAQATGPALQRYGLAAATNNAVKAISSAAPLQQAQQQVAAARAALAGCITARDAACLEPALRAARALLNRDPQTERMVLEASDWYRPISGGQPAIVDGPTTGR